MTREEFDGCMSDLILHFKDPDGDEEDLRRKFYHWWGTAQCKDGRAWSMATRMVIENRPPHYGFPGIGDFMPFYHSAVNAMKYDRPARIPSYDWEVRLRKIDNRIEALPPEEMQDLRQRAKEPVVQDWLHEQEEARKQDPKLAHGMLCMRSALLKVREYNRALVQKRMRELYVEEYGEV